jgi:hypothetical protein
MPLGHPLPAAALDQLFCSARSPSDWADTPVGEDIVRSLYDLVQWALLPLIRRGACYRYHRP